MTEWKSVVCKSVIQKAFTIFKGNLNTNGITRLNAYELETGKMKKGSVMTLLFLNIFTTAKPRDHQSPTDSFVIRQHQQRCLARGFCYVVVWGVCLVFQKSFLG